MESAETWKFARVGQAISIELGIIHRPSLMFNAQC